MEKLTIEQFGSTIKQKYPQYANLSDEEVGRKTIAKYPQYQEKVEFSYAVPKLPVQVEPREQKIARLTQEAKVAEDRAKQEGSLTGMAKNFGKAFVGTIANSEVGLGKSIQKIFGNQQDTYNEAIQQTGKTQADLVKRINQDKALGKDTTKLQQLYNEGLKVQRDLQSKLKEETTLPTTGQVAGQLGGTALDVLTAGTYGKAKQGMNTLKLATKPSTATSKIATASGFPELAKISQQKASGLFTGKGMSNVAKGATIGYGYDVTQGLQGARGEERTGEKAFIPGLGTAIGGGIPVISEANQTLKNITSGKVSSDIMQRVARISKQKQAKFQERAGESVGEYLTNRGIYGKEDDIIEQLTSRVQQSKGQVDDALSKLPGFNKFEPVKTALDDLLARESRISSPGANSRDLQRVRDLANKYEKRGLTMEEINEAKRLYERNVKLDYLKSQNTEGVARANNIDTAIRQWQLKQADKQGFKNLGELNRETYLAKQLADDLGKEVAGIAGNNLISITDWILLSGGDPKAIGAFGVKKLFGSKGFQSKIAKLLAGKGKTVDLPKAKFGGVTDLPAKIPGRNYQTIIELPGEKAKIIDEARAQRVSRVEKAQLALPAGKPNSIQPQTMRLPESISATNLGLDEVRGSIRSTPQAPQSQEIIQGMSLPSKLPQTLETSRKLSTPKTLPKNSSKNVVPLSLSNNLKVTNAYGDSFLGFNLKEMEKRANESGYNLYDNLLKRVDAEDDMTKKIEAMQDILEEIMVAKPKKGMLQSAIDNLKDPKMRQGGYIRNPLAKKELPVQKSSSLNNTTDLIQEAKKYKSAEDFVNKPITSQEKYDILNEIERGRANIIFESTCVSCEGGADFVNTQMDKAIPLQKSSTPIKNLLKNGEIDRQFLKDSTSYINDNYVILKNSGIEHFYKIEGLDDWLERPTKSQLEDIWKQAQGKSLSNDLIEASVASKLPPRTAERMKPNFTPELNKNIAEIIDAQRGIKKVSPEKMIELEADMSSIIKDFGLTLPRTKAGRLKLLDLIYNQAI